MYLYSNLYCITNQFIFIGATVIGVILFIEIINNTREGIIIFFSENKRERGDWGGGANSCPGCRAKR